MKDASMVAKNKNKLTILFFCRNFDNMAGGVEHMASKLMNEMVGRGHDIVLVTWDKKNAMSHYYLDPGIKWYKLDIGIASQKASMFTRFKRQILMRKITREVNPDVAIGFQVGTFAAAKLSLLGLKIPFVAAERNSPQLFSFKKNGKIEKILAFMSLYFACAITIQFSRYKEYYPRFIQKKIKVIHNPVEKIQCSKKTISNSNFSKNILHVGRLSFQKNQLFLLDAFALISKDHPDWNMVLVGDGEYRDKIVERISFLGIKERVTMAGAVKEVNYWYKNAAFLAFPSLWEGFPNVVAEASVHSLPTIAFKNTDGPNELIVNNETGILVDSTIESFASGMKMLIENFHRSRMLGENARKQISTYSSKRSFDQWENLFLHVSDRKSK